MYAKVTDLTPSIQSALNTLGYHKADIQVEGKETVDISGCANDGMRCYYALVALDGSIDTTISYGSWGGQNMFEVKRPDVDQSQHTMLPGVAVIVGTSGGRGNFAHIVLHPSNIAALLPALAEITPEQKSVLESYATLKPAYRPRYAPSVIQELVGLGLLKQNKADATQITMAGKNAYKG
jgi:hypothetical protein